MIEGLPAVKYFNEDVFQIYMGGTYLFDNFELDSDKPLVRRSHNTIIIPGGFKVHFTNEDGVETLDQYMHNHNFTTSFGFFINIGANMETISRI